AFPGRSPALAMAPAPWLLEEDGPDVPGCDRLRGGGMGTEAPERTLCSCLTPVGDSHTECRELQVSSYAREAFPLLPSPSQREVIFLHAVPLLRQYTFELAKFVILTLAYLVESITNHHDQSFPYSSQPPLTPISLSIPYLTCQGIMDPMTVVMEFSMDDLTIEFETRVEDIGLSSKPDNQEAVRSRRCENADRWMLRPLQMGSLSVLQPGEAVESSMYNINTDFGGINEKSFGLLSPSYGSYGLNALTGLLNCRDACTAQCSRHYEKETDEKTRSVPSISTEALKVDARGAPRRVVRFASRTGACDRPPASRGAARVDPGRSASRQQKLAANVLIPPLERRWNRASMAQDNFILMVFLVGTLAGFPHGDVNTETQAASRQVAQEAMQIGVFCTSCTVQATRPILKVTVRFRNSGRAMDMPRRRSRRLEGLKPESPENPTSVLRARRALVELESNPEEKREPGSPRRVRPPGLGTKKRRTRSCPRLRRSRARGPPDISCSRARGHQSPTRVPSPLRHYRVDTPEPGSPGDRREPSKPPPAGQPERDGLGPEKREGSSAQAPASKKPKKEEEVPKVPKGKPRPGRGWKDRSKKSVSQMVQDKALRTSWPRKMQDRQETELAEDFARHREEEKERRRQGKQQRRQEKQQRRAENPKRRPENERKGEIKNRHKFSNGLGVSVLPESKDLDQ
ncbi:hypothetical protein E2I00_017574, partial [Balaenoptera physalus]